MDDVNRIKNEMEQEEKEMTSMNESMMDESDNAQPEKDEQDEGSSIQMNEDSNDDDNGDGDPRSGSKSPGVQYSSELKIKVEWSLI